MYITNFTHYLDDAGNIPTDMPQEARALANFMALIIDATTDYESEDGFETGIRCFEDGCCGTIRSLIDFDSDDVIYWQCNTCSNEGVISDWEGCKWDQGQ